MRWHLGFLVAVATILLPHSCTGSMSFPFTLEATAKMAKLAFAGTVDRIEYRQEGGYRLTDVRFTDIRSAHTGRQDETITLSILGSFNLLIVGMPQFEVGQRYIVLAVDRGTAENWYIPFVGMRQGVFHVNRSAGRGQWVVHDVEGHPVLAIRGGHLAILDDVERNGEEESVGIVPGYGRGFKKAGEPALEIYPKALDPVSRVSEEEFLQAIKRLSQWNGSPASWSS